MGVLFGGFAVGLGPWFARLVCSVGVLFGWFMTMVCQKTKNRLGDSWFRVGVYAIDQGHETTLMRAEQFFFCRLDTGEFMAPT